MEKRWKIKSQDQTLKNKLSKDLNIRPAISALLINRDIKTSNAARRFLESDLKYLHDPYRLKGIKKAVIRLKKAFQDNEKILIYGDYDVDGVTSVAFLYSVFEKFTSNLDFYIPNRLDEGYGLNKEACKFAKEKEVTLVVTVDCGITAKEEVDYCKSQGLDVIITDHHQAHEQIPDAVSVINPNQPDCNYPFKDLAGIGVAFKLAEALLKEFVDNARKFLLPHLDLVALGTVCDVVPLLDENRIFVKYGLKQLNKTSKIGLRALIKASNLQNKDISAGHLGYILGPRINAAGRLGDANAALRLLITKDEKEADALAKLLNKGNKQRQKIQRNTFKEALAKLEKDINFKDHRVIVLDSDWHPGVLGIVASKLVEKYYRPTIMISTKEKIARGSGRSIDNFHLFDAVKKCSDHLHEFGGHKKACGITILKESIGHFKDKINELAHNTLKPEDLFPSITIDAELSLDKIDLQFIEELERLSPFGKGNPQPVFACANLSIKSSPKFLKKNGIKLLVTDGNLTSEAVGFSIDDVDFSNLADKKIDLAFTPTIGSYQGREYITLKIKDIKVEK